MTKEQIFTAWLGEYDKLIRHIINGFEASSAIQEELFQEIALNIWRAIPSFQEKSSVKTFVARIAHNVLATHVAKSVKRIKTQSNESVTGEDVYQKQTCQQPTPYQQLDQKQRQEKLARTIRTLPLEQQQVITLSLEGMSYHEIAQVLMISVNLVGVRLQRAKNNLIKSLEKTA